MRVASVHSCVTEHILRSTSACSQSPTLSRLVDPRCPLAAHTPNVTYPGVQPVPCAIDACVRGPRHAKVSTRRRRRCVTIQRSPAPTVSIDGTRGVPCRVGTRSRCLRRRLSGCLDARNSCLGSSDAAHHELVRAGCTLLRYALVGMNSFPRVRRGVALVPT